MNHTSISERLIERDRKKSISDAFSKRPDWVPSLVFAAQGGMINTCLARVNAFSKRLIDYIYSRSGVSQRLPAIIVEREPVEARQDTGNVWVSTNGAYRHDLN